MGVLGGYFFSCDWVSLLCCCLDPNGFLYNSKKKSSSTVVLLSFVISLLLVHRGVGEECVVTPLGMESGKIASSQISASSTYDLKSVGPQNARIHHELVGGAWCPKNAIQLQKNRDANINNQAQEFLEIDLLVEHKITGTETQGRFGNGFGVEFADKVMFEYWRPRLGKWTQYKDSRGRTIFDGNANTYMGVRQEFIPPIFASKLRFIPHSIHPRTVCMRVEIYGCVNEDGIVSYDVPQGYHNNKNNFHPKRDHDQKEDAGDVQLDFRDNLYDGQVLEGAVDNTGGKTSTLLFGGRGILTDGILGSSDGLDPQKQVVVNGWMGWRNESTPIKIQFHFDRLRKFEAVKVHVSNLLQEEPVEYDHDQSFAQNFFASLTVFSSVNGGEKLSKNEIVWIPPQKSAKGRKKKFLQSGSSSSSSVVVELEAEEIRIPLKGLKASFILLQFVHSNKWLLISEISFVSDMDDDNETMTASKVSIHQRNNEEIMMTMNRVLSSPSLATIFGVAFGSVSVCVVLSIAVGFICYTSRQKDYEESRNTKMKLDGGFVIGISTPKSPVSSVIGNMNMSLSLNKPNSTSNESESSAISTISGNHLMTLTSTRNESALGCNGNEEMQLAVTIDERKNKGNLKNNTNKERGDFPMKFLQEDISTTRLGESAVGKCNMNYGGRSVHGGMSGFSKVTTGNPAANFSDDYGSVHPSSYTIRRTSNDKTSKTITGESDSSSSSSGYISLSLSNSSCDFSQQKLKRTGRNTKNDIVVDSDACGNTQKLLAFRGDCNLNESSYSRNLSSRLHPSISSSVMKLSPSFINESGPSNYEYSSLSSKTSLVMIPSSSDAPEDLLSRRNYSHRSSSPHGEARSSSSNTRRVKRSSQGIITTISGELNILQLQQQQPQPHRNNHYGLQLQRRRLERDLSFRNSEQKTYDDDQFLKRPASLTPSFHMHSESEPRDEQYQELQMNSSMNEYLRGNIRAATSESSFYAVSDVFQSDSYHKRRF